MMTLPVISITTTDASLSGTFWLVYSLVYSRLCTSFEHTEGSETFTGTAEMLGELHRALVNEDGTTTSATSVPYPPLSLSVTGGHFDSIDMDAQCTLVGTLGTLPTLETIGLTFGEASFNFDFELVGTTAAVGDLSGNIVLSGPPTLTITPEGRRHTVTMTRGVSCVV